MAPGFPNTSSPTCETATETSYRFPMALKQTPTNSVASVNANVLLTVLEVRSSHIKALAGHVPSRSSGENSSSSLFRLCEATGHLWLMVFPSIPKASRVAPSNFLLSPAPPFPLRPPWCLSATSARPPSKALATLAPPGSSEALPAPP